MNIAYIVEYDITESIFPEVALRYLSETKCKKYAPELSGMTCLGKFIKCMIDWVPTVDILTYYKEHCYYNYA